MAISPEPLPVNDLFLMVVNFPILLLTVGHKKKTREGGGKHTVPLGGDYVSCIRKKSLRRYRSAHRTQILWDDFLEDGETIRLTPEH